MHCSGTAGGQVYTTGATNPASQGYGNQGYAMTSATTSAGQGAYTGAQTGQWPGYTLPCIRSLIL